MTSFKKEPTDILAANINWVLSERELSDLKASILIVEHEESVPASPAQIFRVI